MRSKSSVAAFSWAACCRSMNAVLFYVKNLLPARVILLPECFRLFSMAYAKVSWVSWITRCPFVVISPAGSSCRFEMLRFFFFTSSASRYLNNGLPPCSPVIVHFGNFFHCCTLDCGCASIKITLLKSFTTLAHLLSIRFIEH